MRVFPVGSSEATFPIRYKRHNCKAFYLLLIDAMFASFYDWKWGNHAISQRVLVKRIHGRSDSLALVFADVGRGKRGPGDGGLRRGLQCRLESAGSGKG